MAALLSLQLMFLLLLLVMVLLLVPSIAITVAVDWLINRSTWAAYVGSVTRTT